MIDKAGDLSTERKTVSEGLPEEATGIRTVASASVPVWLQTSWETATRHGLDRLSLDEIQAEIDAARKARHLQ